MMSSVNRRGPAFLLRITWAISDSLIGILPKSGVCILLGRSRDWQYRRSRSDLNLHGMPTRSRQQSLIHLRGSRRIFEPAGLLIRLNFLQRLRPHPPLEGSVAKIATGHTSFLHASMAWSRLGLTALGRTRGNDVFR